MKDCGSGRSVLAVSHDPHVQQIRNMVLESAGYKVLAALDQEEALRLLKEHEVDLVVLGHSIPLQERLLLAHLIKKYRPKVKILVLHAQWEVCPQWVNEGLVDDCIFALEGPEMLLAALQRLSE